MRSVFQRFSCICTSALLAVLALLPTTSHAAAYATAGKSAYRDNVLWLTWGGAGNGVAGRTILKGETSTASLVVGGQTLSVTCTMGDIVHDAGGSTAEKNLVSYAPGSWSADYMDDLYNIGGTGANNRLIAGLMRKNGQSRFNISCSATLGSQIYRIRGLVVADAESMNTGNEIIEASALGTWNVVEMNKIASGNYTMNRSTDRSTGRQTVSFGPGTDNGTAATMFLSFDESAYDLRNNAAVDMRFRIIGGGNTAIAIGLLVPLADYGDAPASYGEAVNLIDDMRFANDSTNGADGTFNLNASSFRVGGLAPPLNHYLGTVGPDSERGSLYSVNADGDDVLGGDLFAREEDAWPTAMSLSVLQAGERLNQIVVCKGNGEVAGWIDFNRNGRFDSQEGTQSVCSNGRASLTWIIPTQLTPGISYVRLRYRPLGSGVMESTGVISGGEVEDHTLDIIGPKLTLTKTNNSDQVGWYIGQTAATYTLTVRNAGPVATGNPPSVEAWPVLITDVLPDGIAAGWDGRLERDGWRCDVVGQRVSCSYPGVIGAAGSGDEVRRITLPVRILPAARGKTLINHASVGGGHDPHNDGHPLEPGAACTAPGYCASSAVSVPEPLVTYDKSVVLPNGPNNVRAGDLLEYTLRVVVAQGSTLDDVVLEDVLGTGLGYRTTVDAGRFTVDAQSAQSVSLRLPAGTAPGTYLFRYQALVAADAQGYLNNTVTAIGTDNPRCAGVCSISTQLTPAILYSKQVEVPQGKAAASVGDALTYTLLVKVIGQPLAEPLELRDDLGDGLVFEETIPGSAFQQLSLAPLAYRLPAGTPAGDYRVQYRARVTVDSDGQVSNAVTATAGDGPACDRQAACTVRTPVIKPVVTVDKQVDASGSVAVGDVLTYTVRVSISGDKTSGRLRLADLLGNGLAFEALEADSAPQIVVDTSQVPALMAELAAGTAPGTYLLRYRARVTEAASGTVGNVVTPSGVDRPVCGDAGCSTTTAVLPPVVTFAKSMASGAPADVVAGQELGFIIDVQVSGSRTTSELVLDDVMSGLIFSGVVSNGGLTVNVNDATQPRLTLPAGSAPGTYRLHYMAKVLGEANSSVTNTLHSVSGDATCAVGDACQTATPVRSAGIAVNKSVHAKSEVAHGDALQYVITVDITGTALTQELTLVDTLGSGQAFVRWDQRPVDFACPATPDMSFTCTMPVGTAVGRYELIYSTRVLNTASGQVRNTLVASNPPNGDADPVCGRCDTDVAVVPATITVNKSVDTAAGIQVVAATELTYTIVVEVGGAALSQDLTLVDVMSGPQQFKAFVSSNGFQCEADTVPLRCRLPAATPAGTYTLRYTATVEAGASGDVRNTVRASNPPGGDPNPVCQVCSTVTPVFETLSTVNKYVDATGPVVVGDVLTYTLEVQVENGALTGELTLRDTLPEGLAFDGVASITSGFSRVGSDTSPLTFVLAVGSGGKTAAGDLDKNTYTVSYRARVTDAASGVLRNVVVPSNTGSDPSPRCGICHVDVTVARPATTVTKRVDTVGPVRTEDVLTYTIQVEVSSSTLAEPLQLVDVLGKGLEWVDVLDAGGFDVDASQAPTLVFTLPAGTLTGSHAIQYRARVTDQAEGEVTNTVMPGGSAFPPEGVNPDGAPVCAQTACRTVTAVSASQIRVDKQVDAAEAVQVGDLLTYTVQVDVSASRTRGDLLLTDTLGKGLAWAGVVDAGAFQMDVSRAPELYFTLPAGTVPGRYRVTYQAQVDGHAHGRVENAVVASGDDVPLTPGAEGDDQSGPTCGSSACRIQTPVVQGQVVVSKSALPGMTTRLEPGQTVDYRLTVLVSTAALGDALTLVDTPDPGLEILALPSGCQMQGQEFVCVLPAGTPVGEHRIDYQARVRPEASGQLGNVVAARFSLAGMPEPACVSCATEHEVILPELRLSKAVSTHKVKAGDLVRYSLTIENLGQVVLRDGYILDQPPAGFTLVEGSWTISDADGAGTVEGQSPVRFAGLDVAPGEKATINYVLRVGAGVRPGSHVNTARVHDRSGEPVSNNATARVVLASDPLIDDTRVLGTVFDDRDGDGWQDSADVPELSVRGGAAASVLVDDSVLISRDGGEEQGLAGSLADGLLLGRMAGRTSEARAPTVWRLRQQLHEAEAQQAVDVRSGNGLHLTVAVDGRVAQSLDGDLADGLGLADLSVTRSVSVDAEGRTWLELELRNNGVNERGLPGVRVASVEGLLMTTDQYGRYHLEGVEAGSWEQGRQLVLKVDPATLPSGAAFTTDNPLLRRVTPGLPVRFDFGVQMPNGQLRGQRLDAAVLGSMLFAPGSAQIAEHYQTVFAQLVKRLEQMGGGDLVIHADGEQPSLALARATAVQQALMGQLADDLAMRFSVRVETQIVGGKALMAAIDGAGVRVGSVLFDTDKSDIRPEFVPVIDALAELITSRGGGRVAVIGHTDLRLSHAYNTALGLRRARAVHKALSERLPETLRQQMRVQVEQDASAPVAVQE